MDELIGILWQYLLSDEAPELYGSEGDPLDEQEALEVAQALAGVIVAAGWPRKEA